jgi:3-hydroxyisobutyrate dehydrogenase-like beta-hydroxyacid dehydrogenase
MEKRPLSSNALPKLGLIGIGQLGLPVARNLLQAGYTVSGYRRSVAPEFEAAGGKRLGSPGEVASACEILMLCLPDEAAQRSALEGHDGVLRNLKPGQVVIELGTYSREFKLEQAQRLVELGARVLEAEVSGSPPMVSARKAALYIGGEAALLDECKPVLHAMTENQFHLGPYGSAVSMKLIANYLLTIHTLAAAEAMNMGARAGFDPALVAKVISQGAGNSTMFAIRAPMMAERKFAPAPGPFNTLAKYLDLGEEMAHGLGCASPLFDAAAPYFRRALSQGMGEQDISAVIALIEADSKQG